MQTKIIIGTIAFMLTMIILGFVALREPARMETFTDAYQGRSIERGALTFANNCATCHGVNGRAEECFDPSSGEPTGCVGRPLNNADLLCGDRPQRLEATGWTGSKMNFIQSAVAAGRAGTQMPAWSQDFGGPLQQNEVRNVTLFVLNWENEDLCGDQAEVEVPEWPLQVSELPAGDPEAGQQVYTSFGCQGCHGDPQGAEDSAAVGPWLGNLAENAAERIEGYTAADYVYESILKPNAFIAPDCPSGACLEPSQMAGNNFGGRMTPEDMANLMSYLLGVSEFESNVEVQFPEE